ncbi:MAG: hypothetical protein H6R23_2737, partial [Proteobacteria bacterium]|nr:hypothetical protein [Pseudomonadota bacterium]
DWTPTERNSLKPKCASGGRKAACRSQTSRRSECGRGVERSSIRRRVPRRHPQLARSRKSLPATLPVSQTNLNAGKNHAPIHREIRLARLMILKSNPRGHRCRIKPLFLRFYSPRYCWLLRAAPRPAAWPPCRSRTPSGPKFPAFPTPVTGSMPMWNRLSGTPSRRRNASKPTWPAPATRVRCRRSISWLFPVAATTARSAPACWSAGRRAEPVPNSKGSPGSAPAR